MYFLVARVKSVEQQNNLTLRKTAIEKIQYSRETEQLLTVPLATTNVRLNLCVLSKSVNIKITQAVYAIIYLLSCIFTILSI